MNESMEYATAHTDEVRASLGSFLKLADGMAPRVMLPKWPTALDKESTMAIGKAAQERGVLTKEPDVAGLFGD